MLYQEFPPHPALRATVACLWISASGGVAAHARPLSHRVLPDNCIDILWQDTGAPAFAVGMMTRAIQVASAGVVRTVAVRFKPGAAGIFLAPGRGQAPPLHLLADRRTDLDLLWGRSDADRLGDRLWGGNLDDSGRLALIERHLLGRLHGRSGASQGSSPGDSPFGIGSSTTGATSPTAPQAVTGAWVPDRGSVPGVAPLVAAALEVIEHSGGALRIATLADGLGVSRQHLAAQFRAKVGLTPKMYARVCRFRRAAGALARPGAPDWSRLALDCGYFDQSHLIHDFQEFSGSAPESFLR